MTAMEVSTELQWLASHTNVASVELWELNAKRGNAEYEEPQLTLHLPTPANEDNCVTFQVGLRVAVSAEAGNAVVDTFGRFIVDEIPHFELSQSLLTDYANKVAVMVLLPYARQSLADLTQRVFNAPVLMPIFPQGALVFPEPSTEDPEGAPEDK